jgi:hypothetical protein
VPIQGGAVALLRRMISDGLPYGRRRRDESSAWVARVLTLAASGTIRCNTGSWTQVPDYLGEWFTITYPEAFVLTK